MKIGFVFLVLFILACIAFSYRNIRCPSQSEWKFRSSWICNGTETKKYSCLFNAIRRKYEESCKFRPVVSGNGSQYVISVYPNSEPCRHNAKYQPFPLGSNSSSDCVFQKSTCSEEGQILFHHGSPKKDLSCRCNFQKGFGFVNKTLNKCDCIPSQEDCSCYLQNKLCSLGFRLISDYTCLHYDDKYHIQKCPEMGPESSRKETTSSRQLFEKELTNIDPLNRGSEVIVLYFMIVSCIIFAVCAVLLIITNEIHNFCSIDICPYDLNITRNGGLLLISWSKPDNLSSIDILHYNLYHAFNEEWMLLKATGNTYYVFKDLLPSITYKFKVSVSLTNSIESKCTKEKEFFSGLPEKPICSAPFGRNGSIVLKWDSPKDTLIKIDEYLIQVLTDGLNTFEEIRKHFDVLEHEIKDAIEGSVYRFNICSCSNSVRGQAQVLDPFVARHDTLRAIVRCETISQTDPDIVEKDASEVVKKVSNEISVHICKRDGCIVVDIIFISDGCCNEKLLYDTLKTAFQKEMTGAYTIRFTNLWLERLNNPSPPQQVTISRINNGVLVSWKEPSRTFFKTKEYAVEYTTDNWCSRYHVTVPANNKSMTIWNVLPFAQIQVKVYTCICHQIRSSSSLAISIDAEDPRKQKFFSMFRESQPKEKKSNRPDMTVIYSRDENVAEKMTAIGMNKSNTPMSQSFPSERQSGKMALNEFSYASCQTEPTTWLPWLRTTLKDGA